VNSTLLEAIVKTLLRTTPVLLTFPFVLVACGGGDTPAPAAQQSNASASAGAPTADTPAPGGGPVQVVFEPLPSFIAEGTLIFRREGSLISYDIFADSHMGPGDYPVRIHSGLCAAAGEVVTAIQTVTGSEAGDGEIRGTFEASLVPVGDYSVRLYNRNLGDVAISCANLPAFNP